MSKHLYFYFLIFFITLLVSCGMDGDCMESPDISGISHQIALMRIDDELFKCKSREDVNALLSAHPEIEKYFLEGRGQTGGLIADYLFPMISNPAADAVRLEVQQKFGDVSQLKNDLSEAFKRLKFYYPDTKNIDLKIFFSGLRKDIYVNDSIVVVGLDYFIGPDATYQPNNYDYINKRYKPETVPVFIFKYISNKYNRSDFRDNSLLADMIFYGKSFYFTKQILPCMADSLIMGYDPVEWEGSELHMKKIWGTFIERELLYETSHITKSKYVGERPKTFEIGNKCPGRIGRFLGWKIVNAYMKNNPEVTLQELMAETDTKKIFNKSNFKPDL